MSRTPAKHKDITTRICYRFGMSIDDKSFIDNAIDSYKPYDAIDAKAKRRIEARLRNLKHITRRNA